jgi:hypothetical protein
MQDDTLTLTIRVHDPKEKQDKSQSACWATVKVARPDIELPKQEFLEKYVVPALSQLTNLHLK